MQEENQIPLLKIPSIDDMFALKIMTVSEIIEMHERSLKFKRSFQENLSTAVVAGTWGGNPVWIKSFGNPNIGY